MHLGVAAALTFSRLEACCYRPSTSPINYSRFRIATGRCVVANALPNMGHYALAMLQQRCKNEGKQFTLITQGAPDPDAKDAKIPVAALPHCQKCNGLLRPHVVWFGECLDPNILEQADNALIKCDLLLVVGTSAVVQPAAGFAPIVQGGGGVVAEFNLEDTPISRTCRFKFHGSSAKTLPEALGMPFEDLDQTENLKKS